MAGSTDNATRQLQNLLMALEKMEDQTMFNLLLDNVVMMLNDTTTSPEARDVAQKYLASTSTSVAKEKVKASLWPIVGRPQMQVGNAPSSLSLSPPQRFRDESLRTSLPYPNPSFSSRSFPQMQSGWGGIVAQSAMPPPTFTSFGATMPKQPPNLDATNVGRSAPPTFYSPPANTTTTMSETMVVRVLWDLENCAIPRNCEPTRVVDNLRYKILEAVRPGLGQSQRDGVNISDLMVDFNIRAIINYRGSRTSVPESVTQKLRTKNVELYAQSSDKPNAADELIKELIYTMELEALRDERQRKIVFVLISGDHDFATDCNRLRNGRNRQIFTVIVVIRDNSSITLRDAADKTIVWEDILRQSQVFQTTNVSTPSATTIPSTTLPMTMLGSNTTRPPVDLARQSLNAPQQTPLTTGSTVFAVNFHKSEQQFLQSFPEVFSNMHKQFTKLFSSLGMDLVANTAFEVSILATYGATNTAMSAAMDAVRKVIAPSLMTSTQEPAIPGRPGFHFSAFASIRAEVARFARRQQLPIPFGCWSESRGSGPQAPICITWTCGNKEALDTLTAFVRSMNEVVSQCIDPAVSSLIPASIKSFTFPRTLAQRKASATAASPVHDQLQQLCESHNVSISFQDGANATSTSPPAIVIVTGWSVDAVKLVVSALPASRLFHATQVEFVRLLQTNPPSQLKTLTAVYDVKINFTISSATTMETVQFDPSLPTMGGTFESPTPSTNTTFDILLTGTLEGVNCVHGFISQLQSSFQKRLVTIDKPEVAKFLQHRMKNWVNQLEGDVKSQFRALVLDVTDPGAALTLWGCDSQTLNDAAKMCFQRVNELKLFTLKIQGFYDPKSLRSYLDVIKKRYAFLHSELDTKEHKVLIASTNTLYGDSAVVDIRNYYNTKKQPFPYNKLISVPLWFLQSDIIAQIIAFADAPDCQFGVDPDTSTIKIYGRVEEHLALVHERVSKEITRIIGGLHMGFVHAPEKKIDQIINTIPPPAKVSSTTAMTATAPINMLSTPDHTIAAFQFAAKHLKAVSIEVYKHQQLFAQPVQAVVQEQPGDCAASASQYLSPVDAGTGANSQIENVVNLVGALGASDRSLDQDQVFELLSFCNDHFIKSVAIPIITLHSPVTSPVTSPEIVAERLAGHVVEFFRQPILHVTPLYLETVRLVDGRDEVVAALIAALDGIANKIPSDQTHLSSSAATAASTTMFGSLGASIISSETRTFQWFWMEEPGQPSQRWTRYADKLNMQIEAAFQLYQQHNGPHFVILNASNNIELHVDFSDMKQINRRTGYRRPIKRELPGPSASTNDWTALTVNGNRATIPTTTAQDTEGGPVPDFGDYDVSSCSDEGTSADIQSAGDAVRLVKSTGVLVIASTVDGYIRTRDAILDMTLMSQRTIFVPWHISHMLDEAGMQDEIKKILCSQTDKITVSIRSGPSKFSDGDDIVPFIKLSGPRGAVESTAHAIRLLLKYRTMKSTPVAVPTTWAISRDSGNSLQKLSSASPEFRDIEKTLSKSVPMIRIVSIERIQHKFLWESFVHERARLQRRNQGLDKTVTLYHGTRWVAPPTIYTNDKGFAPYSANKSIYGSGVAFHTNPSNVILSDLAYTVPKSHGPLRQIFMAQVILGECINMRDNLRGLMRLPTRTDDRISFHNQSYDSASDGSDVFLIFAPFRAYPEYLITFMIGNQ